MGYIKKLKNNELVGGTDKITIYPVTSTKAVFEEVTEGDKSSFKSQETINKEQQDELDDHEERIQAAEAEDIKSITINGSTKEFRVDDNNNVDLTIYTVDNDPEMPSIANNVEDLRNMVGTSTPVLETSHKTRIETLEGGESVTGSVENKIKTKVDSINSSYQDDNNEYVKYSMTQTSGEVANFNIDETNLKNAIASLNTSISGDNIVIRSGSTPSGTGEAGKIYRYVNSSNNTYTDYMYSGGSWVTLATHDTSNEQAQVAYYTCIATGSGAQATKQFVGNGSLTYTPSSGGHIKILMGEANTATGTIYLQFGTTTSTKKPLYYNGEPVSANNTWETGETIAVYYDPSANSNAGAYFASNAQGGGGKAEKIKYDNTASGLSAENVQGALDGISEICLEKQDLNLTGNYVGKYALNKTTGALVSNSSYRLYEFNLSQYTDEGSLFITGGKGNSDVGVIGQYDSDDNLVGTVYAAATNNKEFEILDGAVTLKLSVYPDSYTVRLVYGIAITQKIDALTSEVDVLSDEIDNLNDVTEDIPAKQAWDAAMKLGTRLSDSSGYNSKYAFAFKKEIPETMVIESIEHPSVSELSVDVIIVDSNTLKIVDKKRVVLDGTKTELLNDVVVIPKGCYIGFAAPEGAVSALTEFKYKTSGYDKTSPSGYVFDSSTIGSIGSTSSYNTCTYVINMREYNSIISQIQNLATSHIEEYTENDCVVAKSAINANTGIVTDNGWSSTQFISIKGYKTILFSVDYTSNNYGIAFYDSNKNILTNKGIAFHSETNTYYTIPDNAEYIRFCAKDDGTIHISITLEATGLGGFMREYSDLQDNVEELNEKTSSIKTKLRILAVGNSYTRDSMEYVAQILSNMGVNNVTMYYLYHSGASLSHWLEQYDSDVDNIIAYHAYGEQDIVREASLATLFESDWDIVSFQQYSVDSVDYSTYTALARLIAAVKEHCTNPDVKIAWHMTWSRWSSESGNPRGLAGYNNIVSAVRQMLNDYGTVIDYIIPTGTAMQNARNTSLNTTHELTADNGGHASVGVGYYIIALTWIQSLVCPFAGKRLIDDDVFTIDVSSVSQSYETENVTDENRLLCQRVALAACSNPFNVTTLE